MSKRVIALLASVAVLSGCGEGGGGGTTGGGTGPIVSTPTPTPGPTPTPTPTYATYDSLTGDQNFKMACAPFQYDSVPPTALPATPFGNGIPLTYAAATGTYTLSADGQTETFGPADQDPTTKVYSKAVAGGTDRLSFSGSNPNGIPLAYTRFLAWSTRLTTFPRQYYCVFGVPTLVTDVPPVSSVTFTQVGLIGAVYVGTVPTTKTYSLQHATATMTVNLTTGKIDTVLTLIGTPIGGTTGPDETLAVVTGTGDIDPSTGSFTGMWSSTSREVFGTFGGNFFGPQGKEFGYNATMSGRNSSAQADFAAQISVFGTR